MRFTTLAFLFQFFQNRMMPSATTNPIHEQVVAMEAEVEVEPPAQAKCGTNTYVMINLLEPIGRFWINHYPRLFGEEALIMLPSPLSFIITGLYAFADIKSQGSEFPFQTHPLSIDIAIASLLFYGLASAAEHFISAFISIGQHGFGN